MNKIKILEVIRQGQIGGGESHLLDLMTFLDRSRFEPVCLSFTDGEMISRLKAMRIRCYVVPTQQAFDAKIQRTVLQLMKDEGIQMVHAHGSRAASNMLWPVRQLRLPFIYTVHGWSFHNDQIWPVRKARQWSEKMICKQADSVICVSQSNADTGRRCFGLQGAEVIENGINLVRFSPDASLKDLRPEMGFAPDDFVAAFIARCTKQKAPLDFLNAVRIAHEHNPRVKGLFVGEGDMDADVDALIAARGMEGYIFRSPFRTDVPELLNCADAYCLPSLWEGLSIALLEAMAMGKAILATPTDGTREVIVHEDNGLIVPFSRPVALAEGIVRLSREPQFKERCGQQARQMVARRFDARRVSERVGQIYASLAG